MIQAGRLVSGLLARNPVSRSFVTVVATPPRVRISFAEKCIHGIVITLGCMAIPTYISVNIKNYRAPEES